MRSGSMDGVGIFPHPILSHEYRDHDSTQCYLGNTTEDLTRRQVAGEN